MLEAAKTLCKAGLRRITISLDAIDNRIFGSISDVKFPVERALNGIDNARCAGISPIKVNMVVARSMNEHAKPRSA